MMGAEHPTNILVLADVCFDGVAEFDVDDPRRQTALAAELAQRAIYQTRRRRGLGAVVFAGRLIRDPARAHAGGDLTELRRLAGEVSGDAPLLALPEPSQRELVESVFPPVDLLAPPATIEDAARQAGALCISPFPFALVTIDRTAATVEIGNLTCDIPDLWDTHNHTELAYCSTTATAAGAIARMGVFGLGGVCLTEHAAQLYVQADDFWSAKFIHQPDVWKRAADNRMERYAALTAPLRCPRVRVGLETEVDRDGKLIVHDADRAGAEIILGAIHWLNVDAEGLTDAQVNTAFLRQVQQTLAADVDVLAHPLRLFYRRDRVIAPETPAAVARMLAETRTPAELNIHKSRPSEAFFAECLGRGVKIALGSDSHAPWEVGLMGWHEDFLRRVSGLDDISPLLWRPV